jgi:hypothetical protein
VRTKTGFKRHKLKVNILGGRVHTVKENIEALIADTKEIGLDVNGDRTKYMVMCGDENAE